MITSTLASRFLRLLLIVGIVAACWSFSSAQVRPPIPSTVGADQSSSRDSRGYSSMEEEMRAKHAIAATEKAHKENLTRARNLAFLGAVLYSSYKEKHQLTRDDIKNLEKAEKLAKSIRSAAGGEEDEVKIEDPPTDLDSALCRFSELSESLKKRVEKTPKHVVSTAVIDEANVLLELIKIMRSMQPKV